MSIFRGSGVGNFTRGGQTTIHYFRMIWQVVVQFSRACLVLFIAAVAITYWIKTDPIERSIAIGYAEAYVKHEGLKLEDSTVSITYPDGRDRVIPAAGYLRNSGVQEIVGRSYTALLFGVVTGLVSLVIFSALVFRFLNSTGKGFSDEEFVRGGKLVDAKELGKTVKRTTKTAGLKMAGIPIPKDSEPAHFLVVGAPGTGKSETYKEMLSEFRRRGERAVVYDPAGDMVSHFFREGQDVILSPFDARGRSWDLWGECKEEYEFDQLAASFIPEQKSNDPFWTQAARLVFSAMARKLADHPQRSNRLFVDKILNASLEEIIGYLKGTEGAAILAEGAEKMAASVRAVLATYVRSLKYLQDSDDPFSIKDWVKNDGVDQWIFITRKDDQKEVVRPLITAWLDTASSAIMSMKPCRDRRIWLMIDELPSLNRLPSLTDTLAQSRKFGGCGVLGVQSYPQLVGIYGRDDADALVGMCSTWAVFRFNEDRSAKWASNGLGATEQLETNEGISYGVNDIRDGVSLSRQRQLRPIVLPTEILFLPDLHGYLKLGRSFPVAKFVLKRKELKRRVEGFVDRKLNVEKVIVDEDLHGDADVSIDGKTEVEQTPDQMALKYRDGAIL